MASGLLRVTCYTFDIEVFKDIFTLQTTSDASNLLYNIIQTG